VLNRGGFGLAVVSSTQVSLNRRVYSFSCLEDEQEKTNESARSPFLLIADHGSNRLTHCLSAHMRLCTLAVAETRDNAFIL